MKSQKMPKKYF